MNYQVADLVTSQEPGPNPTKRICITCSRTYDPDRRDSITCDLICQNRYERSVSEARRLMRTYPGVGIERVKEFLRLSKHVPDTGSALHNRLLCFRRDGLDKQLAEMRQVAESLDWQEFRGPHWERNTPDAEYDSLSMVLSGVVLEDSDWGW